MYSEAKKTPNNRDKTGVKLGIEPNEHQITRFQGKYSYHTHLPENHERPNSPNSLPKSQ